MINEEFSPPSSSSPCKDKKPVAVSEQKDPLSGSNPIGNESPNQVQPQSHRGDVKNEGSSRRRRRRFRSFKKEATPKMKQGPDPATISNQRIVKNDRDSSSNLEGQWRPNGFLDPIPIRVDGGGGIGSPHDQGSRHDQPRIVTPPVPSPLNDSSGGGTVAQGLDSSDYYYYDCMASIGGSIDYKTWAAANRLGGQSKHSEFFKDNGCERCSQRLELNDADDEGSGYERIGSESKSKPARGTAITQRPPSSASTRTVSPLGIGRGRPRIVSNANVMPGLVKMNGGGNNRSYAENSGVIEPSPTMSGGTVSYRRIPVGNNRDERPPHPCDISFKNDAAKNSAIDGVSKWNPEPPLPPVIRDDRAESECGKRRTIGVVDKKQDDEAKATTSRPSIDNCYNPKEFVLARQGARYFVIKSYSEDDVHRSIKYGIWCSTERGNIRLDAAYKQRRGPVYLLFSVNGSGHFCGVAEMTSNVDFETRTGVWAQDKWKGRFGVEWIYVKDVANQHLRHIRLENNENKPVTNSRDTQEVPQQKGRQLLRIIHDYPHSTSLFDDFDHYERRQEEQKARKAAREQEQQRQESSVY